MIFTTARARALFQVHCIRTGASFDFAQRLCWSSSVLPWLLLSGDGVEDGEDFSHASDHGDHLWLAGGEQALTEGADDRVVADRCHGGDKQGSADGASSASDEGFAAPLSGLAREGSDTDEAGDRA